MRDMAAGKLAQSWEGPYRVTAIAGTGAYYFEDLDERPLPRPWNANNLNKILCIITGVSQNLYSIEIKSMMKFFVYAVFDSVIAHQENRK